MSPGGCPVVAVAAGRRAGFRGAALTLVPFTGYFAPRMSSESPPRGQGTRSNETGSRDHEAEDVATDSPPNEAPAASDAAVFGRCNALLLSFASFCLIAFVLWVVSGGKRYREEYAQATEAWRVGSTRVVELTLVKDDLRHLACASEQVIAGLRCGHGRDKREVSTPSEPKNLRPYNTVANELLLGSGLWNSPDLKGPLPDRRFSVICNYNIKGVVKSVAIRFNPSASFAPVGKTVTAGTLTECMLPR
jgi:hypothetical protein